MMSKASKQPPNDVPGGATPKLHLDKTHRHSLQPISGIQLSPSSLRHTQSHRYDQKKRKKVTVLSPIPSTIVDIPEDEENEEQRNSMEMKAKKTSVSKKTITSNKVAIKAAMAYDNEAYDKNSDGGSGSLRIGSSRASSIQSLEVVREQYCCCVRRTKCEKKLLFTVTIMSVVIVVLVIVIAVMGSKKIEDGLKHTLRL